MRPPSGTGTLFLITAVWSRFRDRPKRGRSTVRATDGPAAPSGADFGVGGGVTLVGVAGHGSGVGDLLDGMFAFASSPISSYICRASSPGAFHLARAKFGFLPAGAASARAAASLSIVLRRHRPLPPAPVPHPPVRRLIVITPPRGPRDNAVSGPADVCGLAVGIRDAVHREVKGYTRVHLFLAGPMGLALLLGHRWNRVAPTIVYKDLQADGYEAAFTITA